MLLFNARNIKRIDKEVKKYNSSSFPFFYVQKGDSELINLNEGIIVYIPKNIDGCWATKTPCVGGVDYLKAKKKNLDLIFFFRKKIKNFKCKY